MPKQKDFIEKLPTGVVIPFLKREGNNYHQFILTCHAFRLTLTSLILLALTKLLFMHYMYEMHGIPYFAESREDLKQEPTSNQVPWLVS